MSGAQRLHVVVRGRVQGVGFRWFVKEAARSLDLAGWVRNRQDGGVEVEAEGSESAIAALRRELEQGPGHADVEGVDDLPAGSAPLERPFTITR